MKRSSCTTRLQFKLKDGAIPLMIKDTDGVIQLLSLVVLIVIDEVTDVANIIRVGGFADGGNSDDYEGRKMISLTGSSFDSGILLRC